jgi:hypothetical protein
MNDAFFYDLREARAASAWKPISTAPKSGIGKRVYILVRGPSGMQDTRHFVVSAYHDSHYRPLDPWRMIDNSALSDFGWEPTEWMEIPK